MKGLTNVGNTCYLNSVLQLLVYTPFLVNYVRGVGVAEVNEQHPQSGALYAAFASLVREYWGEAGGGPRGQAGGIGRVVDSAPVHRAFVACLRKFGGSRRQHDAHEALVGILDKFHAALSTTPRRAKLKHSYALAVVDVPAWTRHIELAGYSILSEVFQYQIECTVRGPGGFESVSFDHGFTLSVPVAACSSVRQCLARYFAPETIDDFAMESSDGSVARSSVTLARSFRYAPLVLALHLNRFAADGTKLDTFVHYSDELRVGSSRYRLVGACFHRGTVGGGHYSAMCCVNGRWFAMDDETARPLHDVDAVISRDAYVLFYQRDLEVDAPTAN